MAEFASGAGILLLAVLIAFAVWPASPAPPVIHRTFTHAPSPIERDSLAALAANGTTVQWRGTVPPAAFELDVDGFGRTVRAAVAAPPGTRVTVSDWLGPFDSVAAVAGGVAFRMQGVTPPLTVRLAGETLYATIRRPAARSVVVFGAAGWEPRFVLDALDAMGVPAAARIRVGPQTWVTQGRPLPLDTARYAVAVVLGTLDPPAAGAVRRFVRSGGGLVIAPGTTGLDDVAPGRFGSEVRPPASLSLPMAREDLVTRPLRRLNAGATSLDVASAGVRVAVQRIGAGRVVQLADQDTWRLALASDAGRAAHARLWLEAITLTSSRHVARPGVDDDVAPRAALVAALGPRYEGGSNALPVVDWERLVAMLLFAVLVGEWAMRRLGGRA